MSPSNSRSCRRQSRPDQTRDSTASPPGWPDRLSSHNRQACARAVAEPASAGMGDRAGLARQSTGRRKRRTRPRRRRKGSGCEGHWTPGLKERGVAVQSRCGSVGGRSSWGGSRGGGGRWRWRTRPMLVDEARGGLEVCIGGQTGDHESGQGRQETGRPSSVSGWGSGCRRAGTEGVQVEQGAASVGRGVSGSGRRQW